MSLLKSFVILNEVKNPVEWSLHSQRNLTGFFAGSE